MMLDQLPTATSPAASFAAVAVALVVAHQVADHWVQSSHQAGHKGKPGWEGRVACAAHVASYTLTTTMAVLVVWLALDLPVTLGGVLLGQAVSAVTHYWADRRTTLATLAERLRLGGFYGLGAPRPALVAVVDQDGNPAYGADGQPVVIPVDGGTLGTGAYALDQSWHYAWLGVAALVTVLV
ncbi:transcriptional regulator [Saccharomonospora viridis]|uniref:transcriptional regulator n=1 Tax=Saccharomonospora viridis TaxID=1852 RepID=UPI002408F8A3|nr:transcriptional regulator [Saccharomonospora viridis]